MLDEVTRFPPAELPPNAAALRAEVRAFLDAERAAGSFRPRVDSWLAVSRDFSHELGRRGWIGMTWPKEYGGHGRSALERYVVTEELLAAGAPLALHWTADRQSGPLLLRYGSERAKREIVPAIVRGECFFAIGMSEPDSGSDLASVRTRAVRVEGGWAVTGAKLWTSNARECDYMITLLRTQQRNDEKRHEGLSQFVIDTRAKGVTIRPIADLAGRRHFNEVVFDQAFVPDDMVVGAPGEGWKQVTSELAFERSGPERFLSTYRLVVELIRAVGPEPEPATAAAIGRIVAALATLRRMSISIAGLLQQGKSPNLQAAVVKDIGTVLEQEIPEIVRQYRPVEPTLEPADPYAELLAQAILHAPGFTLRGGTKEILRGIIARGLGLR